MKDKIERFSKGDFEYELPFICLSEEEIRFVAEAGKRKEGTFIISNSIERPMKGVIYSSDRLLQVKEASFEGTHNTVHYEFNALYLKDGDLFEGELRIVSDCGEIALPFRIQVQNSFYVNSLGKIKDLFQFTNLARTDWSEAKKVFRSEDFERIFLCNEERYKFIYRNLIKSISTSQALEEFLIAIHKKGVIRFEADKTQIEYEALQETITDKLNLTKNSWGYAEIRLSTDVPFIQLEQKILWADRFTANTHSIIYSIDPTKLKKGRNYGHIFIKTPHQLITVEILCRYDKEKKAVSDLRRLQKVELGLSDIYLDFRLNRINLATYLEEAQDMQKHLPGPEVNRRKELLMIHLAIVSGKDKIAEELLSDLALEEIALRKRSVLEYCTYLYLKALYSKDDRTVSSAADAIRECYERINGDWRLLWLLLNTDRRYEMDRTLKLYDIREQYEGGCRSPILYYEAVSIYNEDPVLLRELNDFEIQVLNFGIKNWIMNKEAALQYTYLANKRKKFHPVIFRCLEKLYDEYGTSEILSAICCMLIKGMKREEKYFEWYRLGVDAQLRVTELYEYYMYSISDTMKGPLAQPVLLYFIYNSNLNDRKKAYLYANIVRNKDKNESIYRTYYKRMEVFAAKLLEVHQISEDLAVLYREFFARDNLSKELTRLLPSVIYRNELICNNPNITNVIVLHKELNTEVNIVLKEGKGQVDIFTNNVELFLVDGLGNRFVDSIDYSVTPYLNSEEFERHCIDFSNHPMLLLHMFDRYQSYRIMNDRAISLRTKVITLEGLSREYATSCCQTLIEYYYEYYNQEQLEYYLDSLDLELVRPADRLKYLEILVARLYYQKAIWALSTFGLEGIGVNRLVKLCSGFMLTPQAQARNDFMITLCHYVFVHHKYDEAILRYLIRYYNGATREMFQLWKAAKEFELSTHALEERLLTQMLFSESYIEDSFLIFNNYYKDITNHTLVRAFLSYYAYKYLLHDSVIDSQLFPVMRRELYYEENEICLLAWLKYNTTNDSLSENDLVFIEYNIDRLVKKGIILPFYLDYRKKISLPEQILDKYYVIHLCDPGKQVYLHYRLPKDEDQEYITERMVNMFHGIHKKEFVLFYHEEFQYYITEESKLGTNITESVQIQYECETPQEEESKYSQINLMLIAMEMQDDKTLLELMEQYRKNEYMIKACFKPIEG